MSDRPATTDYGREVPDYSDLMTVDEWMAFVKSGGFTDYDGHGLAVRDGMADSRNTIIGDGAINPSDGLSNVPLDATHICWFNR